MAAKPLASYYNIVKKIVSKKEHAVPVVQWWGTFALFNHITGKAISYAIKVFPEGVEKPQFLGAVLRFVINRKVLSEIRDYLAKHPGIENPDEVANLIIRKIDELLADEKALEQMLRDELAKLGVPETEVPKYLEALRIALPKIKEYIDTEGRKILREVFKG